MEHFFSSIDGKKAFEAIHEATDGSDLITSDEMQCTFNLNKYRVVYVVNQETTLYNKGCLTRAKQVNKSINFASVVLQQRFVQNKSFIFNYFNKIL